MKILKPIEDNNDDNEKLLKYKEIFNELSAERMGEIYNMSKQIDFNNLIYHFKSGNLNAIKFIDFRGLLHIYENIKKW